MPRDQIFVGSTTIVLSIVTFVAALGLWPAAYELTLAKKLRQRFGERGARGFYLALSLVMLVLGVAILCGVRPSFAIPESDRSERSADVSS
ncbi:hypothetical protein [Rosistilla carotiformis]|nr:hypothetical protein [Rosistilla carotiformis]